VCECVTTRAHVCVCVCIDFLEKHFLFEPKGTRLTSFSPPSPPPPPPPPGRRRGYDHGRHRRRRRRRQQHRRRCQFHGEGGSRPRGGYRFHLAPEKRTRNCFQSIHIHSAPTQLAATSSSTSDNETVCFHSDYSFESNSIPLQFPSEFQSSYSNEFPPPFPPPLSLYISISFFHSHPLPPPRTHRQDLAIWLLNFDPFKSIRF